MTTMDLKRLCERHGKHLDVYIAQKLSKVGKRFAFVRFLKSKDLKHVHVVEELRRVWVGSFHQFATWAIFNKDDAKEKIPNKTATSNNNTQDRQTHRTEPNHFKSAAEVGTKSYTSVIRNTSKTNPLPKHEDEVLNHHTSTKEFNLLEQDLLVVPDSSTIILGKVRDINSIDNLYHICYKEGFNDLHIAYMGGDWVWIEFKKQNTCLKFKQHDATKTYFVDLKPVHMGFTLDSRVIWMEISGLPLHAWNPPAFKKIVAGWGKVLFIDDDEDEPAGIGRIAIQTVQEARIEEEVKVQVAGITYQVRVREVRN